MRIETIYTCELCEATHSKKEDAIACEAKGFEPHYEVEEKVLFQGYVVTINERDIEKKTHKFSYTIVMLNEDNPGRRTWNCNGWKDESDLHKLPSPTAKSGI